MLESFVAAPFKKYDQFVQSGKNTLRSGKQSIKKGLGDFDGSVDNLTTHWIPLIWHGWVRPTASLLMLIRFSLLVAFVLAPLLIVNSQAQEVIRTLAEDTGWGPRTAFPFAALLCAFMVWYWARVAFYFQYDHVAATHRRFKNSTLERAGVTPKQLEYIERWLRFLKEKLPPFLGASVFGLISIAFIQASEPYPETADPSLSLATMLGEPGSRLGIWSICFIAFAVIFFFFSHLLLRPWLKLDDTDTAPLPEAQDGESQERSINKLWDKTWPFVLLGVFLATFLTVAFANFAVDLAPILGTGAIALLFAAALIPNGTFLVLRFGERWGMPVIGFAMVWLLIVSFLVDNHRVRQHAAMASYDEFQDNSGDPIAFPDFDSFQKYYNGWIEELEHVHRDGPIPVFIISAEGGGIRAAYWTALTLGYLQDKSKAEDLGRGGFARHIFAISGVSGGSLGAATFAGLLANKIPAENPAGVVDASAGQGGAAGDDTFASDVDCILEYDFLAPTVAAMLFPDFFQRFVPVAVLNDRAIALERAWERAWNDCTQTENEGRSGFRFSDPYESLWSGQRAYKVPLLFLNSTVVETGQRMISSPIPLDETEFKTAFSEALETTRTLGHESPLSTVVHTSARFTYVSPAGTVRRLDSASVSSESDRLIRVVDGGYFENSGAVTAGELLTALERAAVDRSMTQLLDGKPRKPIIPIVIHISNDPIAAPESGLVVEAKAGGFLPEVLSPVEALLNVRPARGYQARATLADRVRSNVASLEGPRTRRAIERPGVHMHFRLCEYDVPIPLGWTLSDHTRTELKAQLSPGLILETGHPQRRTSHYHQAAVSRIMNALGGGTDSKGIGQMAAVPVPEIHADCESENQS